MKASKRVLFLLAAATSLQLVGCSTKDISSSQGDKNVEVNKVSANEDSETNNSTPLTLEEALDIIGNITNGEKDLVYHELSTINGKDYHGVLEEPFDETFRYLVDVNTREVFTQAPIGSGKLEKVNARERDLMTVSTSTLTKTVEPKLKTVKGFDEAESLVSKKFKEILSKNSIELNHAAPDDTFAIHKSEYSKFTKKYEQKLFYVFNRDTNEGHSSLTIQGIKEYHSDLKLDPNDNYIKTIHELYNFTTGAKISYEDFTKAIQEAMDNGYDIAIFPKDYVDATVTITQSEPTRRIEFAYKYDFNNTLKKKFHRKKYETVQGFIDESEKLMKEYESIKNKYASTMPDVLQGPSEKSAKNEIDCIDAFIDYDKRTFRQYGRVSTLGKMNFANLGLNMNEDIFNDFMKLYKIALGEEIYNKVDKSDLTLEKIKKYYESAQIKYMYMQDYDLTELLPTRMIDAYLYIDNAKIEMNRDSVYGIGIDFSIPVEAEGIRSL